jgi:hypothetical protein
MAKKRTKRAYGKASWQMREAAREAAASNPELGAAARLLEDLKERGLGAVQDGVVSFQAVTGALQQTLGADKPVVSTYLDSAVYREGQSYHQVDYRLVTTDGGMTQAKILGAPREIEVEEPETALAESRDTALIEARPAGRLNPGALKRDLNIIEGTVLITALSQNGAGKGGRRYSDQALKQIASMAEGLPAYLNHVAPEQAFKPRDVKDLIGVHRNVRYYPREGKITSDLHVMEHQAPLVFGIAEKLGDHIGNSLVSRGLVQMEGETEVVKEVLAVRSADIVSDPATTRGLFESRQDLADPFGALIAEIRESLTAHTEDTRMDLAAILAHLKATPSDQKALAEHFGLVLKTDVEAEVKPLKEEKAALVARAEKAESELQEAQVKLDGFEAQAALAAKRAKLETVIAEHDLGKKYGKNADAVSSKFKTLLEGFAEDQWKDLLDDRLKSLQGAAPQSRAPQSGLKADLLESTSGKAPIADGAHARLAEALTIR